MKRRHFLAAVMAAAFASRVGLISNIQAAEIAPVQSSVPSAEWRRFEITTRVMLPKDAGATQLWLPVAQTAGDYQASIDFHWQGNGQAALVHDSRYGAPFLQALWKGSESDGPQIEVVQTVATRDRGQTPLLPLTEAERKFWTAPTAGAPTDGIAFETAARITADQSDPRAQIRAIYNWVIDHTYRDPDTPGCGRGDFKANLRTGKLGGKCVDISALMVGLARAAGFPAREVYGIRVGASKVYSSLGRNGDISKSQHCRAEVFLDERGWLPLDPADVRRVVLKEKVALDVAAGWELRERMFGHWEMNWVGYNSATDIELPGSGPRQPDFNFLMYPCAFTEQGRCPSLEPGRFRYEITSKEVTA